VQENGADFGRLLMDAVWKTEQDLAEDQVRGMAWSAKL
jgi:hypothetical protein